MDTLEQFGQNLVAVRDSLQVLVSTVTDIEIHLKSQSEIINNYLEATINYLAALNMIEDLPE
jgi:hypothetical protein